MDEYIKREDVLKILERSLLFSEKELDKGRFRDGCIAAIQDDIGNIKYMPAADVAPKSEVAREIFAEVEKIISRVLCLDINAYSAYEELKKKYTEEK